MKETAKDLALGTSLFRDFAGKEKSEKETEKLSSKERRKSGGYRASKVGRKNCFNKEGGSHYIKCC